MRQQIKIGDKFFDEGSFVEVFLKKTGKKISEGKLIIDSSTYPGVIITLIEAGDGKKFYITEELMEIARFELQIT